MTKRIDAGYCPDCGVRFDSHEGMDRPGTVPQSGDMTVCWNCDAIPRFTLGGTVGGLLVAVIPKEERGQLLEGNAVLRQAVDLVRRRRQP